MSPSSPARACSSEWTCSIGVSADQHRTCMMLTILPQLCYSRSCTVKIVLVARKIVAVGPFFSDWRPVLHSLNFNVASVQIESRAIHLHRRMLWKQALAGGAVYILEFGLDKAYTPKMPWAGIYFRLCFRRSTNSFKRKLFGQSEADADNLTPAVKTDDDVRIHPLSAFRKYWEIVTIVLVVYTVLILPFRAAFYLDFYKDLDHGHNLFQQLQVDTPFPLLSSLFPVLEVVMCS